MTVSRTWPLALVIILAPALAAAQPKPTSMDEDVEVLRRLLTQRLQASVPHRTYVSAASAMFLTQPQFPSPSPRAYPGAPTVDVEGAYLKGTGAVFMLSLPRSAYRSPGKTDAPPALSDWERMRREVRGEPAATSARSTERRETDLADTILRVLAENGQQLQQLGEQEALVVVVSFRSSGVGAAGYMTFGVGREGNDFVFSIDPLGAPTPRTQAVPPRPAVPGLPGEPAAASRTGSTTKDQELLGDLHLKQQRWAQAVESLTQAARLLEAELGKVAADAKSGDSGTPEPDGANRLRQLYAKLAQAFLGMGSSDKAREVLDRAIQVKVRVVGKEEPQSPSVPARLVVTVPKKLALRYHADKMTFEEFKKAASVEYTPAAAAEKK